MICPEMDALAELFTGSAKALLPLQELSERLTELRRKSDKEVILMVDEMDGVSNNSTFLSFLRMLRNKFLGRQKSRHNAFFSVFLSVVHVINNLKLKLRPEEQLASYGWQNDKSSVCTARRSPQLEAWTEFGTMASWNLHLNPHG